MIIYVEEQNREQYAHELHQYFQLRKRVFHDQLGWQVIVHGDIERDSLDDQACTYVLYISESGIVTGGNRLIPTTQKTLLETAFNDLMPNETSFYSSTIWESSRYCVDRSSINSNMSSGAKKATIALSIGNYDYAIRKGIERYVGVTDERLFQFSQLYNVDVEVLSEKRINGCQVVCAVYNISEKSAKTAELMRPLVAHSFTNPSPTRTTPS